MTIPTPPDGPADPPLRGPLDRAEQAQDVKAGEWIFSHIAHGCRIFKRLEQGLERLKSVPCSPLP